ncbi:MAG: dynamin family protein [Planctomycetota bacterium]
MRTKLDDYCRQFQRRLDPLLAPLDAASAAVETATSGTPGRDLLPRLLTLRGELRALGEKVASQQAYVLIFGPLKSGKSTLMNAIAAAYVSEVSSLPAYPCMVFVGPGDSKQFRVTRYDGQTQDHDSARALAAAIDAAHAELAAAIRAAEQRAETFDPQDHLPQALRRVDVRLPGSSLAETGAVLVDTPGLYTRMRFGYDRMTREFRDAAACAIFVVKSDTLFLEQVFAEFHDLLDLFSRIFLVVNVDSGKRDVGPDGKLVPSVEQSRPDAILQAFQNLAMPASLHRATGEGRVRMFAVDLMRAAAAVLQKQRPPEDFAAFSRQLGEFLGSDEYLAAFLRDSLRRVHRIGGDLARLLAGDSLGALQARIDELREQLEFTQAELDLLRRAVERDFAPAFARAERTVADEVERHARDAGQKLLRALGASIDTWFLSGHSLRWLLHDHWRPLLADYRAEVAVVGRRALEQTLAQADAGLDLPAAVIDLCERRGIDLRALRTRALAALGTAPAGADEVPVDLEAIPLKKGLLDRVTFRSLDAVRRRLFGPPERPDQKIPARDKTRHLGEPGRLHLHQCVTQLRATLVPETAAALEQHLGRDLRAGTTAALLQALREELAPLQAQEQRLQREIERLDALQRPLRTLQQQVTILQQQVPELAREFGSEVPTEAAVDEPQVVLEPQGGAAARTERHEQPAPEASDRRRR